MKEYIKLSTYVPYLRFVIGCCLILYTGRTSKAQNELSVLLQQIEQNNTTLHALRNEVEAQKLENRADTYLNDPEVGFNYLWGTPTSNVGKRYDFNVTQSIDIATLTGRKGKVADQKNHLVEWQYRSDRMNILLEAKLYSIDLIYYNALHKELSQRQTYTNIILEGERRRLERGDGTMLEFNNVQLAVANIRAEIDQVEIERNQLKAQLTRLNGGNQIDFLQDNYPLEQIPSDFDEWFDTVEAKNPILSYVKQEVELSKQQLSLSKSMSLPTIKAGYMNEKEIHQRYQGITLGISMPLWSNRNRIKQAKAELIAAESRKQDAILQLYNQFKLLHQRTIGLQKRAAVYRNSLEVSNNEQLLKQALDAGEISILLYHSEMMRYYEAIGLALDAERSYHKALAELSVAEL